MPSSAIDIHALKYSYRSKKSASNDPVLSIESWTIERGERVFLFGDSGSGKTTLLNLLCGILQAEQGNITLFNQDMSALSSAKRDAFRASNIGVVFQKFNLIPYLSVLQNIQLAAYFAKNKSNDIQTRTKNLISSLKLPLDVLNRKVSQLSVGQQQRIAIARALINSPELLLVDEPTSSLDASARDAFMQLLMQICADAQTTLVFVSHDDALGSHFDRKVNLMALNSASSDSLSAQASDAKEAS